MGKQADPNYQAVVKVLSPLSPENQLTVAELYQSLRTQGKAGSEEEKVALNHLAHFLGLDSTKQVFYALHDFYKEEYETEWQLGVDLEEAVTEYLSIEFTTRGNVTSEAWEVLNSTSSGYRQITQKIKDLADYLARNYPSTSKTLGQKQVSEFTYVLTKAKQNSQPGLILKYLREKIGVRLTPQKLFALNFSNVFEK